MKSSQAKLLYLFLVLILCLSVVFSQESEEPDQAYYEGRTYSYLFEAPEDWILDIDNAYEDGYTAALFPEEQTYTYSDMTILIWVFKNDSLSFGEFVTADSAYYLKRNDGLQFRKTDTLFVDDGIRAIVMEADDPGAESSIAMIGYIDVRTEVVIYELSISERMYFAEGASRLHEALRKFTLVRVVNE